MTRKHKRPQLVMGTLNTEPMKPTLMSGFTGSTADVPVVQLLLSQIEPRASQPRRSFGEDALQRLTDSIRLHGVIQPLTVHETKHGYQLVAGERRWRAAQAAGLKDVPVRVVRELSERELQQYSAVENLQREDLNAVDEADAVLDILEVQLGLPRAALTPRLERLKSIKMRDPQLIRATPDDQEMLSRVEQAFQGLGRGAWTSFVSNRLPVLRLPEDLLAEVRGGTLEYTKAVALRSVAAADRGELIVYAKTASVADVRARLRQLKDASVSGTQVPEHIAAMVKALKASQWEQLTGSERKRVEQLLAEAASILRTPLRTSGR